MKPVDVFKPLPDMYALSPMTFMSLKRVVNFFELADDGDGELTKGELLQFIPGEEIEEMMSSDDGDKNHTLSLVEYMSNYMKSKVKPNWESKTIENEGVDRDDMTNYLESNGIRGERLKKALEFFANDSSKSDNLVSFSAIERYLNVDIPEIVGEFCARYQKAKNEPAASK